MNWKEFGTPGPTFIIFVANERLVRMLQTHIRLLHTAISSPLPITLGARTFWMPEILHNFQMPRALTAAPARCTAERLSGVNEMQISNLKPPEWDEIQATENDSFQNLPDFSYS